MKTSIELDEELIAQAMQASGSVTQHAAVETALRLLVNLHAQTGIRKLRGKVQFFDDVSAASLRHVGYLANMVIVDTSVWIDYFAGVLCLETEWLQQEVGRQAIGLTDLICCELLQGVRGPQIQRHSERACCVSGVFLGWS